MGLVAGISVLTIVETIYWFGVRLLRCRISETSTRVAPLDAHLNNNKKDVIVKAGLYVLKYLKESSIHGLRYILDGKIIQRFVREFKFENRILPQIISFQIIMDTNNHNFRNRMLLHDLRDQK